MTLTVDDRELIDALRLHAFDDCGEKVLDTHIANIAADRLQSLLSDRDKLEQRVRTFLAKLDECSPHIDSVFLMMKMHGGPYRGPDYAVELADLRSALTQTEVP